MTGSDKHTLDVYIGTQQKIAELSLVSGTERELAFTYNSEWQANGFAISPHLPLSGDFGQRDVHSYLQNLLPEGKGLDELVLNTTVSRNNTFGLIRAIGQETSGALSFRPPGQAVGETLLRPISNNELAEKLERSKSAAEPITYWDGKTRLSVAGVQDKLNLFESGHELGFAEGELASNRIFKFETGRVPCIAVNEFFTMTLAKLSGLNVPEVDFRRYGETPTLVVNRFDRHFDAERRRVRRRHVIDGCQALNLPPSYKYERQFGDTGDGIYIRDGVSFPKLFSVRTNNVLAYQTALVKWMTFNLLTANYDAHGKNISYFVGKNGLELAPFYDLVNVEASIQELQARRKVGQAESISPEIPQVFAMSIGEYDAGNAGNFSKPITSYMLADLAKTVGLPVTRLQLLMQQTLQSVLGSIDNAKEQVFQCAINDVEKAHIERCMYVIANESKWLQESLSGLPEMEKYV